MSDQNLAQLEGLAIGLEQRGENPPLTRCGGRASRSSGCGRLCVSAFRSLALLGKGLKCNRYGHPALRMI